MLNEKLVIQLVNSKSFKRKLKTFLTIIGLLFSGMFIYLSAQNYSNPRLKEELVSVSGKVMKFNEYENKWIVLINDMQFSIYKEDIDNAFEQKLLTESIRYLQIQYFPEEVTFNEFTAFGLVIDKVHAISLEASLINHSKRKFQTLLFSSGFFLFSLVYLVFVNRNKN